MKKKTKQIIKKTKKSLVKSKNDSKQKKAVKKHVLDDDDQYTDLDQEATIGSLPETQDPSSNDDANDDVEAVNTISDPLETIEDQETFNLGGSTGDGEGHLETVRSNPRPKLGWSDKVKPKFSPGDLVVPIELTKKEALDFEPWKIVCAYVHTESYSVKKSRVLSEVIMYGDEIKLAPKNGKPFVNHWEANDPFKVVGVKITCPSNRK